MCDFLLTLFVCRVGVSRAYTHVSGPVQAIDKPPAAAPPQPERQPLYSKGQR